MSTDLMVLRAMLRLARRQQPAEDEAITLRVDVGPRELRAALRRLDGAGLIERRDGRSPRLTMSGLAAAVGLAAASSAPRARSVRRSSRAA